MLTGESALSLMAEPGVPKQTLRRWKAQGWVDAGLAEGVASPESEALGDSRRRIKEIEDELALVRAASEISDAQVATRPEDERPSQSDSPRAPIQRARQPEPQAFLAHPLSIHQAATSHRPHDSPTSDG